MEKEDGCFIYREAWAKAGSTEWPGVGRYTCRKVLTLLDVTREVSSSRWLRIFMTWTEPTLSIAEARVVWEGRLLGYTGLSCMS